MLRALRSGVAVRVLAVLVALGLLIGLAPYLGGILVWVADLL